MRQPDSNMWNEATEKELNSLTDMGTFSVVNSLPPG